MPISRAQIQKLAKQAQHRIEREATAAQSQNLINEQITKWKLANADEMMEPLPPVAQARADIVEVPGLIGEPRWVFVAYGGFVVTITASSSNLLAPHEARIALHTYDLQEKRISLPIAQAWTLPFIFKSKDRALEQYIRVLEQDIF